MGLIYSSDESAQLIQALTSNLASGKDVVDQLKSGSQKVVAAVDGQSLAGAAYTAGKGLFSELIIPTITRVTTAVDKIELELQNYQMADQEISSEGYLDEENLQQQIATKKMMKAAVDASALITKTTLRSNPVAAVLDSLLDFQKSLNRMADTFQEDIEKLNEKLEKLYRFSSQTTSLFISSLNDLELAMQGVLVLNDTTVNSDGTYSFPAGVDKSWFTTLQSKEAAARYKKSREAFLKREKEYTEALRKIFNLNPNGTIQSAKLFAIERLLLDGNLTDVEKDVLMFYLHYQISGMIDSGSTIVHLFAANPLLQKVANAVGFDISSIKDMSGYDFKNMLENGLYSTPGLNQTIKNGLSFEYNAKEDYYYTNESGMQSHFGFGDTYDHFGYPLGMDLNTSVYEFQVNGKEYRYQLWKGTYGFGQAYGAEQGWYVRDANNSLSAPEHVGQTIGGKGWQPVADEANQIRMYNETWTTNGTLKDVKLIQNDTQKDVNGASNGTHYWNLAIKSDPNQNKSNLYNKAVLYIPDREIRDALVAQMSQDGQVTELKNNPDGTVTYTWGK